MFRRKGGYPGNRRIVSAIEWEMPVREVEYVYGLHGTLVQTMQQRDGMRAGYGAAGSFGADGYYATGPMPPLQGFIGAEAFRLAASRQAERRDYQGEAEAVVFAPMGAL